MTITSRREMLMLMAAAGASLPASLHAADADKPRLLPLDTPGVDHLDIVVPDVEKSSRFYMGLLRTSLHAQPFRGGFRYFVLLGSLPENRTVGYIAVGQAFGRPTGIGHFCTSVANWRRDSAEIFAQMKERFGAAGFGDFPGGAGFAGTFDDPDGIEIQFLPAPDTLVTAAVPSDLVPAGQGLVVPQRLEYVQLRVSNLDRALAYYRLLYGKEKSHDRNHAVFSFRGGTRLILERAAYQYGNAEVKIMRYGIRVSAFDKTAVAAAAQSLGGKVTGGEGATLRLKDIDGIEFELVPGAA
jgi:catechol 2,3-dioxygenase-like lactoylglutathione lyase family enzyme